MASDIWQRTTQIVREETRCRHMGYSFRLTARVLLYVPSHRQDSTYHGLCYTSRGTLAGTRNRLIYMHHPRDRITHTTASVTPVVERCLEREIKNVLNESLNKAFPSVKNWYAFVLLSFQPVLHDWCNKGRGMCCPVCGRKEGYVLFNDTLNTFLLTLYDVRHMVMDHSDSERGNPLPPHGLLFPISSKGYFICTIPQTW